MKTLLAVVLTLCLTTTAHAAYLDFNFNGSSYMDSDPTRALQPVDGYPRFDADMTLITTRADQDTAPDRGYYTNAGIINAYLAGPTSGTGVGGITGHGRIAALRVVQFADYNEVTMTGSMKDGNYPNAPIIPDAFTLTLRTLPEDPNTVPSLGHVLSGEYQVQWTNVFRTVAYHGVINAPLMPMPVPPAVLLFASGIAVLWWVRKFAKREPIAV